MVPQWLTGILVEYSFYLSGAVFQFCSDLQTAIFQFLYMVFSVLNNNHQIELSNHFIVGIGLPDAYLSHFYH